MRDESIKAEKFVRPAQTCGVSFAGTGNQRDGKEAKMNENHVMNTYSRSDLNFVKGHGPWPVSYTHLPLMQLFQEVGRGMPGVLSKIGLGTFMDPRFDGGKLNRLTKKEGEDLVEYIPDFLGEEYLFYKSPGMNVALLRGTSADEHGNISCEREAIDLELLSVAQAVNCLLYTSRCG